MACSDLWVDGSAGLDGVNVWIVEQCCGNEEVVGHDRESLAEFKERDKSLECGSGVDEDGHAVVDFFGGCLGDCVFSGEFEGESAGTIEGDWGANSFCEFHSEGDLVSVPFNVACGRCRNCRARRTNVCETVNPHAACGAYGFNLGDWQGGQAEYLFVPYADFQLLRFPDKDQAMEKIRDLALLSDILPTAFHGLMEAGAKPGSTVYIAGAGPVGRCGAAAARLLGASCIIVGDYHQDRLDLMKNNGCETINLNEDVPLTDQIEAILGEPMVDCAVDYVGSEAHGIGREAQDMNPAYAINQVMDATRAGGATGIVGVYGPDPLASSKAEQEGTFSLDFGKAWIKSPRISAGQAPIMHYNRDLMMSILWDRMPYLSSMLNTKVISLDEAPEAYATFDKGVSEKFIIDPHGLIPS